MSKIRPTDLERLIEDYHRDHAYIAKQKFHWIEPKERAMRKLPKKSEIEEMDKMSTARKIMKAVTDRVVKGPKRTPKAARPKNEDPLRDKSSTDLDEDDIATPSQKKAKAKRIDD